MVPIKIGLLREGKIPPDKRVVFTPKQVEEILQRFPNVSFVCQTSEVRCYKDEEYFELGIPVKEDVSDCDILMGVKEVPVRNLIEGKTYLFFSHTIKKQPYNRKLLREILSKKIQLIDYETLRDFQGNRLVAFGRYAGIVGAYNALWAYGLRYEAYTLRRAFECFDVNDLKLELRNVDLPPVKIILTGAGRVGKGAMETLDSAGIRKVSKELFLTQSFNVPVYVQLSSGDYHRRKEGGHFNREEFHTQPERYYSYFTEYAKACDILIAGAYWNPKAPVLFKREDMLNEEFQVKIIADITCDINGSIPSTKRASTITDPLYDYDPVTDSTHPPLTDPEFVTVMGVDNLPCELPRSASEEFGRDLIDYVMRPLLYDDIEKIITRATIAKDGMLTPDFQYLQDYVDAKVE
jgi:saccharopine dehydrogenase (NAD+, L-lysine forming)